MRILEIITPALVNEDTDEHRDLLAIAEYVADYLISYKPKEFVTISDMAHYRKVPQFNSGVMINLLFDYETRFTLAKPRILQGTTAYYDKEDNDIVLDKRLVRFRDKLISILVHEIQHALDNYKSHGKAMRPHKDVDIKTPEGYKSYLERPQEINARFSQALNDIIKAEAQSLAKIGRIGTARESMQVIKLSLEEHGLSERFFENSDNGKRQYNRLLTRAYKFYDNVKHMIEATPDQPQAGIFKKARELIKRYLII